MEDKEGEIERWKRTLKELKEEQESGGPGGRGSPVNRKSTENGGRRRDGG